MSSERPAAQNPSVSAIPDRRHPDPTATMTATVVVATYNRAHLLPRLLAALARQETPPSLTWEVIVVDNNSSDGTRAVLAELAPSQPFPLRCLFEARQGKSYAVNTGVAHARGDILLFTDDDVLPEKDWVSRCVWALRHWAADVVGGRILLDWESPPPPWLRSRPGLFGHLGLITFGEPRRLTSATSGPAHIWGGNMAMWRQAFLSLGGLDTRLGRRGSLLVSHEDVDLVERAIMRGYRAVYDPSILVYHRIERHRLRKSYFLRWAFHGRRVPFRAPDEQPDVARLLGVPRWRYRDILGRVVRTLWSTTLRRSDAFDLQYDLAERLGVLAYYLSRGFREKRRRP